MRALDEPTPGAGDAGPVTAPALGTQRAWSPKGRRHAQDLRRQGLNQVRNPPKWTEPPSSRRSGSLACKRGGRRGGYVWPRQLSSGPALVVEGSARPLVSSVGRSVQALQGKPVISSRGGLVARI